MKDVRPHGHLVEADLHVEAVFAAVDHVSDLLPRVIPEPTLRVNTTGVGNVLPRAMRVRFRDARNLVGHNHRLLKTRRSCCRRKGAGLTLAGNGILLPLL
jgi:hypothetical protein